MGAQISLMLHGLVTPRLVDRETGKKVNEAVSACLARLRLL